MITIKKPSLIDIPELLPLWEAQYRLHRGFDPEFYVLVTPQLLHKIEKHLNKLIQNKKTGILIARVGDSIAGFITFEDHIRPYLDENITRYADVMELFVAEKYRRQMIGQSLIRGMEEVLAKRGIYATQLGCAVSNTVGIAFYEKIGYRGNHIWFIKKSATNP